MRLRRVFFIVKIDREAMAGEAIMGLISTPAEGFGLRDGKRRRLCGDLSWEIPDTKVSDSANDERYDLMPLCSPFLVTHYDGMYPMPMPMPFPLPLPLPIPQREIPPNSNIEVLPRLPPLNLGFVPLDSPTDPPGCDFGWGMKENKQRRITVMRAPGDEPSWMRSESGWDGWLPEFFPIISDYFHELANVFFVTAMYRAVWCEGPDIGSFTRCARWYHINVNVELSFDDGTTSDKRYFVELISFHGDAPYTTKYKVIACVPLEDPNVDVLTESSRKCEICDCSQVYHPSVEFCIPHITLLNPYPFEEWYPFEECL